MNRTKPFRYFTKTRRLAGILAVVTTTFMSSAYANLSFTPLTISTTQELATSETRIARLFFQEGQSQLTAAQKQVLKELVQQTREQASPKRLNVVIAAWPNDFQQEHPSDAAQKNLVDQRLQNLRRYLVSQDAQLRIESAYNMASQTSELWSIDKNSGSPGEALVQVL